MNPAGCRARRAALVQDDAIRDAQRLLWDQLRLVAEPAAATSIAALTSGARTAPLGRRIGILVTGANTDPRIAANAAPE